MAVQDFFTWGEGGAKLTPEQLAQRRLVLKALKDKEGDTSPVQHWTQGLARVADALGNNFEENRLGKAETELGEYNSGIISSLLSGNAGASPAVPASGASAEMAATTPSQPIDMTGNEVYSQFIDTVKQGGVQNPYALAAIAATGKAESGFDPGNVNRTWSDPSQSGQPGTAGGIMSWRGPRYDALAATGDLSPQGQAKFFLQENPQLIEALNKTGSVEEAQSLMNKAWQFAGYDQPGGEAASRLAAAQSLLPSFQPSGEVASAGPQAAIEAISPTQGGSLTDEVAAFEQTPAYSAQFPGQQPAMAAQQPTPVQQVAQAMPAAGQAQQQAPAINEAIIRAMTDPRATPQTKAVAQALMQQQQAAQQQSAEQQQWMARQQYEQQQKRNDPAYQIGLDKSRLEYENLKNPPLTPGDTLAREKFDYEKQNTSPELETLYDEKTGQEYKAKFNRETGQYERVGGSKAPSGTSLSVGPNGEVQFTQGGGKALTEGQSKDAFFTTRMTAATPTLDAYESALMSLPNAAAGAIPFNLGNYAQSEEYQLARDAGRDFVTAYLRKDSGAALTPAEEKMYGEMLLPQPGDKAATIEAKRTRRAIATEAIKSGMPVSALDNVVKAIKAVPGADEAQDLVPTDIPGVKIRRKN